MYGNVQFPFQAGNTRCNRIDITGDEFRPVESVEIRIHAQVIDGSVESQH